MISLDKTSKWMAWRGEHPHIHTSTHNPDGSHRTTAIRQSGLVQAAGVSTRLRYSPTACKCCALPGTMWPKFALSLSFFLSLQHAADPSKVAQLADHHHRALKWHYGAANEDRSINEARANAAEIVAWRFLTHLCEREIVDYCLYEIPDTDQDPDAASVRDEESGHPSTEVDENTALLAQTLSSTVRSAKSVVINTGSKKRYQLLRSISRLTIHDDGDDAEDDPTKPFVTLNALEIAAVADAKRFLSQHVVQKIITGIWNGDIVFWDGTFRCFSIQKVDGADKNSSELTVDAVKKPRFYNKATADPFSRLRVPRYLKGFEVVFFIAFLFLYYSVLVERNPAKISLPEVLLYIWFAAFFYDELSEWSDAGSIFYATDIWNLFDITMICIGFVFAIMRKSTKPWANSGVRPSLVPFSLDLTLLLTKASLVYRSMMRH